MAKSGGISHISGFVCGLSDTATLVTIIFYLLACMGEIIVKIYCIRGICQVKII